MWGQIRTSPTIQKIVLIEFRKEAIDVKQIGTDFTTVNPMLQRRIIPENDH